MSVISPVAGWLLTYVVHSTILLGGVALATRFLVRRESLRESLWKAALVGGVVTATLAMAVPRPGAVRVDVAALGVANGAASPEGQSLEAAAPGPGWELDVEAGAGGAGDVEVSTEPAASVEPEVDVDRDGEVDVDAAAGFAAGGEGAGAALPDAARPVAATTDPSTTGASPWVLALTSIWALIAGALLLRLSYRHLRLRWLLRSRREVPGGDPAAVMLTELRRAAGVWKPVRLTCSSLVGTPLALGGVEVCVPERLLTELGPEEQRAALAHELAHLARRDPVWQIAGAVVGAVLFFQPLNQLARRGIRSAAEYLADGWAVEQTGSRMELARCLAAVAGWVAPSREPALAGTVAMAEGGSPLLVRVQRLLEREPEAPTRLVLHLALAVGVVAAAGAFAPAVGPANGTGGVPDTLRDDFRQAFRDGPREALREGFGEGVPDATRAVREAGRDLLRPMSDAPDAGQEPLEVHRFDRPGAEGDGFVARLNEAGRAAGQSPYWVAYAIPAVNGGRQVLTDSEPWNVTDMEGLSLAGRLGVEAELMTAPDHVLVLARLVPAGATTGVERLTVRRPELGMRVGGDVYWLGLEDPTPSFRWLRDIYTAVRDPAVREAAVDAIGMHPAPEVEPFLRRVLGSGDDSDIREEAVEGLATQRPDTVLARLFYDVAMNDPEGGVRREAAEQLGRIHEPIATELLERLAFESDDPDVQRQAAESLGEIATPAARAALERVMADHVDEDVRREALDQLGDAFVSDGESLLAMAMHDDDPDMRREAVELMERLPPDQAVVYLRRAVFESGDGTVERQAAETLGDLGTEAAFQALLDVLERNPSEDASFQAVESIAENFPGSLAIPALRRVLETHPSSRVRREALDHLGDLGG
jgi:HEAT repeat protein/beta-lactamase regulating signal transducer with metallopeptidase domain